MSDQDQNKTPQDEDDELESLSADEKAAFEKIMAEISAATGNDPSGGNKPNDKDKVPEPVKNEAPPADSAQNAEAPAPEDTLTVSADVEETAAMAHDDSEPEASASHDSLNGAQNDTAGPPETEEELNTEQQAALDQIMAEIESRGKGGSEKKEEPPPQAEGDKDPDENPDLDQQASLDKIMAEIESQRKGEPEPPETPAPAAEAGEDLDDDQQAALNQIMAEIESKRKGEPEKKEDPTPTAEADEELDDDQQAALNQIMAEIESKRKGEPESKAKTVDTQEATDEEDATDPDQEAALQNILNEINAQKNRGAEKAAANRPDADELTAQINAEEAGPTESAVSRNESLSMEEFDAELSNLLSPSENGDKPDTAQKEVPIEQAISAVQADKPSQAPKEYPVLKEVQADQPQKTNDLNRIKSIGIQKRLAPKLLYGLALAIGLIAIGMAGFWAYHHFFQEEPPQPVAVLQPEIIPAPESSVSAEPAQPPVEPAPTAPVETGPVEAPIVSVKRTEIESPVETLTAMKADLSSARKQIQSKIFDIQQLKSYYERGITEESEKIEDQIANGQIPAFDKAMANKAIELGLRAIQRRQTYVSKLDTPLEQLTAMSEELLYLERRTHTYEILNSGINGLPVNRFKQDVTATIGSYLRYNTQLTIDEVEVSPPPLTAIWDDIVADLKKKTSLLAQREPLNREISAEICKGNFERKYLLTALSAKTAQCLVGWKGKDLYLNAMTELPPDVAEILSRWPGEWLSLNGVREMPAESARHLAQWPGKRLSLNGLSALSPEATAHLSKWKGEQLEMVGLKRIGRWENYGTRLFLSEKLRRQLEAQLE